MADTSTVEQLWSLDRQEPDFLPWEIILPDGKKRTDPDTFTYEELASCNYTGPYTKPFYHPDSERLLWDPYHTTYRIIPKYPPEPVVINSNVNYFNPVPEEFFWQQIRDYRDNLLSKTDWAVNPYLLDVNLTDEQRNEWIVYRQKLRDLTKVITYDIETAGDVRFPDNLKQFLPEKPSSGITTS